MKWSRWQGLLFRLGTITASWPDRGSILTVLLGWAFDLTICGNSNIHNLKMKNNLQNRFMLYYSKGTSECTWGEDTVHVSGLQQAVVKLLSDSLQLLIKAGGHKHVVDLLWAQLLLGVKGKTKNKAHHNEAHLDLNNISSSNLTNPVRYSITKNS